MAMTKEQAVAVLEAIKSGKPIADGIRAQLIDVIRAMGPEMSATLGYKLDDEVELLGSLYPIDNQADFEKWLITAMACWAMRVLSIEAFEAEVREAAR